jgi:hypothetical protein
VLTGFPRTGGFGGGVILRSILEGYPEDRLLWISLYKEPSAAPRLDGKNIHPPATISALVKPFARTRRAILTVAESRRAADAALRDIAAFSPQICWMVLDFNSVLVFRRVMKRIAVPVHVSVHDDPVLATALCSYPLPARLVRSAFAFCFTRALSRDCISERMRAAYEKRYGVGAFVVTRGVRRLPRPGVRTFDKGINVVLGGLASNCAPPWPHNLVRALFALRKATGRPVEFHCFDPAVSATEPFVKVHALLPDKEFEKFLAGMHVGYACDPLTPLGRKFAASSLPTKIITYAGFGLPFVYHGPRDSTVGDFLKTYRAGVIVESEDADDIFRGFLEVVDNYEAMRNSCCVAAAAEFDATIIRARVLGTISKIALEK